MSLQRDADERSEQADFGAERVRPSKRPPIVMAGWVAVLAGVVALGLSGRSSGGAAAPPGAGAQSNTAVEAVATGASGSGSPRPAPSRYVPDVMSPGPGLVIETSAPGPIGLEATRMQSAVFVHGDIYAQQVTWVSVSLQSLDGQVGGWASVSIPGAAGEGRDHRPAVRFDLELAVPTSMSTGVLLVQANAYNAAGGLVASTGVRLGPPR